MVDGPGDPQAIRGLPFGLIDPAEIGQDQTSNRAAPAFSFGTAQLQLELEVGRSQAVAVLLGPLLVRILCEGVAGPQIQARSKLLQRGAVPALLEQPRPDRRSSWKRSASTTQPATG